MDNVKKKLKISIILLVLLIPSVFAITIREGSCNSDESCFLSMFQENNSHVGECEFYNYSLCISGSKTVNLRDDNCTSSEQCILSQFQENNSHVGRCGFYNYSLCIAGDWNVELTNTTCSAGYTSLITFFQENNSHVGSLNHYNYTLCLEEIVAPAPSEGGISRGGVTCKYDWQCTPWFPSICPIEGVQKRLCYNRGTCSGLEGKPDEIRTCVPEIKRPLFDLFLKIPRANKWIFAGEEVLANLELINVRDTVELDVFMKYWIVDSNDKLIYEKQETRAVQEGVKFDVRIMLSEEVKPGFYRLYAQASYDTDKIAMAEDSFEVVGSRFKQFINRFLYYIIFGIIIMFLVYWLVKRYKPSKKKRKKKRKKHKKKRKKSKKRKKPKKRFKKKRKKKSKLSKKKSKKSKKRKKPKKRFKKKKPRKRKSKK